jgi:hypothetical protein
MRMTQEIDPPNWHDFKELETELEFVSVAAAKSFWPTAALAVTLIDSGVIKREDLLKTVRSFISYASAVAVLESHRTQDACGTLLAFEGFLDTRSCPPGRCSEESLSYERQAQERAAEFARDRR